MNSELIPAALITVFCLFSLYYAFFILTKQRFLKAENFSVLRDLTPLPDLFNYWLIKIFIVISGSIVTVIGFYGIITNL